MKRERGYSFSPWWSSKINILSNSVCFPDAIQVPVQTNSWFTHFEGKTRIVKFKRPFRKRKRVENLTPTRKRKRIGKQRTQLKKRKGNKKPKVYHRTCKIRIFPNKQQREKLRQWIGTARFLYNQTIDRFSNQEQIGGQFEMINELMGKNSEFTKQHEWMLQTPSHVKSNGIRDAYKARKTCFGLIKSRKIKKFNLKFKRKKNGGIISIPKSSIFKNKTIYPRLLKTPLKISNQAKLAQNLFKNGITSDCRIKLDSLNRYYLLIPYGIKIENQDLTGIVSLDPGVRTFQTYYSPNGCHGELGKGDIGRITRLCYYMDDLQSKFSNQTGKKKSRMKKAWKRMIQRVKNLVNEVHRRTSKFLTDKFSHILLPSFETSQMTKKLGRNITTKTARKMLSWCHYRFKERLVHTCERKGVKLSIVTEEYTSKTCTRCGVLNQNLGGKKMFECLKCGLKIDRDVNGARNVFLKNYALP